MSKDEVFGFEKAEESPGFLLWQVSNLWQREIRKILEPLGLTHAQFVLLAVTYWLQCSQEETTQIRISDQAKTDPMTTSTVLRTLERKKLVRRFAHNSDTRAKLVEVTNEGQKLLQEAVHQVEAFDERFFLSLGKGRKEFLKRLQDLCDV
ncbi:transcriptional regulator, MarR family [Leptospira inadai serovar Lyme str. 10]|uniref:Transcriptional regulator, MarR family n=2 Tax=Leptospira inadai serovar Lyme TaxID=293084 RepID=V6HC23_9LEPT|nr:MarR family transcriptional regulator [Leptospira inadai]EQA36308.1 transcriptional regulator, MarR family [Leptospira inadai serovar Lyme str. 10]PNV74472.1 MarR family transcriptional regulator [Leptospira inadai serovar Lyme]